jgi:gamma-glutamyltranspeptidase/glutathione hydrolase
VALASLQRLASDRFNARQYHARMRAISLICVVSLGCSSAVKTKDLPPPAPNASSVQGVAVSVSGDASRIGRDVLAIGGNAVDATVATAFALAVTFPEAGNIGGGGFMLIHFPDRREPVFIDYREIAPAAVNQRTYFRKQDRTPHRLAGVPGTVRGLALAHKKYGRIRWRDLVLPAVQLARDGFVLDQDKADSLNRVLRAFPQMSELQRVFAKPDKTQWQAGDRLVQPDFANTLQLIANKGPNAFYTGPIADQIVAEIQRGGGLITKQDLADYQPKSRTPVKGAYRGYQIHSAPPPSSGGIALIEMLNVLEHFDLRQQPRSSHRTIHFMTEAMRRAYADRARHLGDPDFTTPPAYLTSRDYAKKLADAIDPNKATPSDTLATDLNLRDEPENTTHFSVIDSSGMAVSNTYTLEESYGGKIVVPGAGFLLNNELGDFNPQPGVTTRSGQIGTPPNLAAANKRPLSSMTPTIVTKDNKVVIVTGSPGGRTIINTVLCVLINRLEYDMSPRDCIDAPRHHHQWLPDRLQLEADLFNRAELRESLRAMGHALDTTPRRQGDAHSIFYDPDTDSWLGVADPRRSGAAAGR